MAKPSFFKVFFADQSSTQLRIPPAFRHHIEADTSKKLTLKGPSGSRWRVGLVKNSNGLFFEDGWKEFVADQSLVTGDFLVFQYDGHSRFSVSVFDKTACEKKAAFSAQPSVGDVVDVEEEREEVVVKEEIVEEEVEKKPSIDDSRIYESCGKRKRGRPQKRPISSPNANLGPDSKDWASKCKSESQPSHSHRRRGRPRHDSGISPNQVSEIIKKAKSEFLCSEDSSPNVCFRRSGTLKQSKEAWELLKSNKMSCERGDSVKVLRIGCLISQRRPITEEEVHKALQNAMAFKSTNPFVLIVLQEAYVYSSFFMSIPSWFASKHLPKENTHMTVWDPENRSWKITYISHITRGALSGGWGKFSYANNLEKYDVCVMELIESTHLRVHIFRVVDEITPLLRYKN